MSNLLNFVQRQMSVPSENMVHEHVLGNNTMLSLSVIHSRIQIRQRNIPKEDRYILQDTEISLKTQKRSSRTHESTINTPNFCHQYQIVPVPRCKSC